MKRITAFILCLFTVFSLTACKSSETKGTKTENSEPQAGTMSGAQIANPVSDISLDDMAKDLGIEGIKLDGVVRSSKITAADIIYSIDAEIKKTVYNIRLSKNESEEETDISGVYLSDSGEFSIFDSANEESPSTHVQCDSSYSKAYGYWNGYHFSVSANKKIPPEDMHKTSVEIIKSLISKDNLAASGKACYDTLSNGFDEAFFKYIESRTSGNYMVSPLSFRYALGLLLAGAGGDTKAEMLKALNVKSVDEWTDYCEKFGEFTERFYKRFDSELEMYNRDVKEGYIDKNTPVPTRALRVANSVWKRDDIKENFRKDYSDYIKKAFNAEYFAFNEKNVVKRVNDWASEKTGKMIPKLLPDNYNTTDLAVILMNALYYKNGWENPFIKTATKNDDFHTEKGKTVKKSFMKQTENYRYFADNNTQMVIIPMAYGVNMAFVLGDNSNITDKISKASSRQVNVKIPKMDIETSLDKKELIGFLKENGVNSAFSREKADFSGMINHKIWVDDIIQKTKIKTDEDGVEAAAVTAIMAKDACCPIQNEPIDFIADRPFSFFIYADCNDITPILFAGKVME